MCLDAPYLWTSPSIPLEVFFLHFVVMPWRTPFVDGPCETRLGESSTDFEPLSGLRGGACMGTPDPAWSLIASNKNHLKIFNDTRQVNSSSVRVKRSTETTVKDGLDGMSVSFRWAGLATDVVRLVGFGKTPIWITSRQPTADDLNLS